MHLNTLAQVEQRYKSGVITKATYIEEMYGVHQTLFDYRDFLQARNVANIAISRDDVTVTTRDGVTMVCNPGDWRIIPIEILNFGDYEVAETELLKSFLSADSVVVDIGANIGWYCIQLGRAVPKGRVIAFEPIPDTLSFLRRNLSLNGAANVEVYELGLSDEAKDLIFFFHPKLSGATSARNLIEELEAVEVRAHVQRMDDTLAHEPRIDLIKCDVEGAEIFALRGGLKTILRTKPVLFVEMLRKWCAKYGYHPNDIIELLAPLDYSCFAVVAGARLEPIARVDESTVATNFIFLHRERHAARIASLGNA